MKHVRFNEGKVFIVNINMVYSSQSYYPKEE